LNNDIVFLVSLLAAAIRRFGSGKSPGDLCTRVITATGQR
jgi:hypothetical protein